MSNLENSKRAAKGTSRTDNASSKKHSDKPQAAADITQLTGIATYDEATHSFLFEPSDVAYGRLEGHILHGVGQQLTDGTLLFNPVTQKRYRGLRIAKLPHGWVNMTRNGNIYLALSVPMSQRGDVGLTLYEEAADAAIAANNFLRTMSTLCGKLTSQLTWDDVVAIAAFSETSSKTKSLRGKKTKSERGGKPFGDAAPEVESQRCEETSSKASLQVESQNLEEANRLFEDAIEDHLAFGDAAPEVESQRCEEASSKRDCPTGESGQDHCGVDDVGDNNTTTDHIIYFGIQAQAEGYVAERTSTRRVKDPNGPNGSGTDEAPYSEDLTQGGEVLPTVRRNQNDISSATCHHSVGGAKKGKTGGSKRSSNQDFRVGGDC